MNKQQFPSAVNADQVSMEKTYRQISYLLQLFQHCVVYFVMLNNVNCVDVENEQLHSILFISRLNNQSSCLPNHHGNNKK